MERKNLHSLKKQNIFKNINVHIFNKMAFRNYYCHDTPKTKRVWNDRYIQILSVDPARLNFALRVEKRYISGKKKGIVEPVLFWKKDFTKNTFVSIIEELEKDSEVYLETHVFLVEKQMKKTEMLLIMQHVLTYFIVKTRNYPLCPDVIQMSAKIKGDVLGYNSQLFEGNKKLKKWSSSLSRQLCEKRNDSFSIKVMDYWLSKEHPKNVRKDDDLADTIVMCEAYYQIKLKKFESPKKEKKQKVRILIKNVE